MMLHLLTLVIAGTTLVIAGVTLSKVRKTMALIDDMRDAMTTMQADLAEINTDLDDLIARIGTPGTTITQEDVTQLQTIRDGFRAAATKHTPGTPPV